MDFSAAKERLLEQKMELLQRVRQLDSDINRNEPVSADFAEQVVEQENLEVVRALDKEGREELKKIELALHRIDSGDYGICVSCGKDIDEQRLAAIPSADRCIDCARNA